MKYKVVRTEHMSSDEVVLEADDLDELSRMLSAKTGGAGFDVGVGDSGDGFDLGFGDGDGDGGGLL